MKKISSSGIFREFYDNNYIYVDKTECIFNLIDNNKKIFISRPRRFGKSLTLDTIGTLFEEGVEPYFKNTWIYDKWTQPITPVLRLDFLNLSVNDIDAFKQELNILFSEFAEKYEVEGFKLYDEPYTSFRKLLTSLSDKGRKIVILIDEYDRQLVANIDNPELCEEFRSLLRQIYAVLKGAPAIKFMAVTGVTRLKDVSIFSAGNDIKDISNSSQFSQLIGFTRDEIRRFYIDYLKLAASIENKCSADTVTDAQVELILDKMAQEYDGYCFDQMGVKKVFSTWSVNNFLQEVSGNNSVNYGDYWYENGGIPTILVKYLETHELNAFDYLDKQKVIKITSEEFLNPSSLQTINQHVLMCQTGYLTLRSPVKAQGMIALGIPNGEIYRALCALFAIKVYGCNPDSTDQNGVDILNYGSFEEIANLLNAIANTIPYDRYPVNSEASLQSHILLYLIGAGQRVISESHTSKGRSDLLVDADSRRIVLELKYAKDEREVASKLQEAKTQVKAKDYGNIIPLKDVIKIAAVFNGKSDVRSFTCDLVEV